MDFIMHFYISFGTNQLTEGPVQIAVFLPISVFRRKGISNGVQTEWNLRESYSWNKRDTGNLEWTSRKKGGGHKAGRRASPPWARPPTSCPPRCFLDLHSNSPGLCLFQKRSSWRFHFVWIPFDIPFLRNTEIGKKNNNLHWAFG